MLGNPEVITSS